MSGRTPEREPTGVADAGPSRSGHNGHVGDRGSVTDVAADDAETAAAQKAEEAASVEAAIAQLWRGVQDTAGQRPPEALIPHYPPPGKDPARRVGGGPPP